MHHPILIVNLSKIVSTFSLSLPIIHCLRSPRLLPLVVQILSLGVMRAFPVPLVPLFNYKPISVMVFLKTFISSSFPVSLKYLQMADCSLVWPPPASAPPEQCHCLSFLLHAEREFPREFLVLYRGSGIFWGEGKTWGNAINKLFPVEFIIQYAKMCLKYMSQVLCR